MNAQQIRKAYLDYFAQNGHTVIPRANLVPQDDPTTLFTGSGMQPLLPYLLGAEHPAGNRLVDSQTCFRAEDVDEVGDNRHTVFFEMLGNWSLGDYFKQEQLPWFFGFLTDVVGLDPNNLYVTAFIGDDTVGVPRDTEAAEIWKKLFAGKGIEALEAEIGSEEDGYKRGIKPGERIFYYDAKKNWWSRAGVPANMPVGEPGGPDSEVFYEFTDVEHDVAFGEFCHPNCDCGRFMEIGNSVFMAYVRTENGFEPLPKPNVDFGGGLERIAAAAINSPDMFKISVIWPVIEKLEQITGKAYAENAAAMRVIADHLRAAVFLVTDGVLPSNNEQGYVLRRLIRRAVRFAFDLEVTDGLLERVAPVVVDLYCEDFPEVASMQEQIIEALVKEEKVFRQTLKAGIKKIRNLASQAEYADGTHVQVTGRRSDGMKPTGPFKLQLSGEAIFKLYDTYGFPKELVLEEAEKQKILIPSYWEDDFNRMMDTQRERSRTATKGQFKGGLEGHSDIHKKYHTATHLMYRALRNVLGDHVVQRGSNITSDRLRFDFSHPEKVTPEQIKQVEDIVNEQIQKDWPMGWREEKTEEVLGKVLGAFGDRYGETVKVYTVGDPDGDHFSREICGGPHVDHTGQLAEEGKAFKILKEEASSAGVRRIKAALV